MQKALFLDIQRYNFFPYCFIQESLGQQLPQYLTLPHLKTDILITTFIENLENQEYFPLKSFIFVKCILNTIIVFFKKNNW